MKKALVMFDLQQTLMLVRRQSRVKKAFSPSIPPDLVKDRHEYYFILHSDKVLMIVNEGKCKIQNAMKEIFLCCFYFTPESLTISFHFNIFCLYTLNTSQHNHLQNVNISVCDNTSRHPKRKI